MMKNTLLIFYFTICTISTISILLNKIVKKELVQIENKPKKIVEIDNLNNVMVKKIDKSVNKMWKKFVRANPQYSNEKIPESWYFCDNEQDANICVELVVNKVKQATSPSLWWFNKNKQSLPKVGDLHIITNWKGKAKAIIRTILVTKIAFKDIQQEHAFIEGEGDKTLEYWKKTHWEYYSREMRPFNENPSDCMIIVFEQFETICI